MARRRRKLVSRTPPRRIVRAAQATAPSGASDADVNALVEALVKLVSEPAATEPDQREKLNNIREADRLVKRAKREVLLAAKAGDFKLLDLPVDDRIAEALVHDRLEVLNDRRNLMLKSGVVGAVLSAVAIELIRWAI